MVSRGAGGTVTPGTSAQTKYAGYYSSNITISGDPDLIPANILSGKDIFGVSGTLQKKGSVSAYLNPIVFVDINKVISFVDGDGIWVRGSQGEANLYNPSGTVIKTVLFTPSSYIELRAVNVDRMFWYNTSSRAAYVTDKNGTVISSITSFFNSSRREPVCVMHTATDRLYMYTTNGSSSMMWIITLSGTEIYSANYGSSGRWLAVMPEGAITETAASSQYVSFISKSGTSVGISPSIFHHVFN
ncbi:hypothetical protein [Desulfosporosinus youngiae]|uniref:hypothetical protein n=1 Tax=Desulfosporosinus youngiae TaxID=339862 RepID=UPI00031F3F21|nr:hypothetical protein [Desulfosporosinus youngiae]